MDLSALQTAGDFAALDNDSVVAGLSESQLAALLANDHLPVSLHNRLAKHHLRFPDPMAGIEGGAGDDKLLGRPRVGATDEQQALLEALDEGWESTLSRMRAPDILASLRTELHTKLQELERDSPENRLLLDQILAPASEYEPPDGPLARFNARGLEKRREKFEEAIEAAAAQRRRPKVVWTAGDSWFQFPVPSRREVVDVLLKQHPEWAFYCTSAAGEWLEEISGGSFRIEHNGQTLPCAAVLLSGGGNDIVGGPGGVGRMLRPYRPGRPVSHCLGLETDIRLAYLQQWVLKVLATVPQTPVLMHGYAIPFPGVGKHWSSARAEWMKPSLDEVGFRGRRIKQRKVIAYIMNRFNQILASMAERYPNFHYIDCRDLGTCRTQWHDELHPRNSVWKKVASRYSAKLQEILGE